MTILKTKGGVEINTDDFKYYGFGDYVRKHIDTEWGTNKSREQNKTKKYRVSLSANVSATAYCIKYVDAKDEQEAEEIAQEDLCSFDWDIDTIDDVDDIEVDDVEEMSEDES